MNSSIISFSSDFIYDELEPLCKRMVLLEVSFLFLKRKLPDYEYTSCVAGDFIHIHEMDTKKTQTLDHIKCCPIWDSNPQHLAQ